MSRPLACSVVACLLSVVAFADVSEETKQSGTHPRVLPQTVVATQIAHAAPWREPSRGWLGRYPNQPLLVDPDLPDDPDRTDIPEYPNWGNFTSQADYDITLREVKAMGIDGIARMIFGFTPKRFFSAVETSSAVMTSTGGGSAGAGPAQAVSPKSRAAARRAARPLFLYIQRLFIAPPSPHLRGRRSQR